MFSELCFDWSNSNPISIFNLIPALHGNYQSMRLHPNVGTTLAIGDCVCACVCVSWSIRKKRI